MTEQKELADRIEEAKGIRIYETAFSDIDLHFSYTSVVRTLSDEDRDLIVAALRASGHGTGREALEWPTAKVTNPDIADPTGVPYIDCLLHRLLDAQQDINLEANEHMSQLLFDASAIIDEVETVLRKVTPALTPVALERTAGREVTNEMIRAGRAAHHKHGCGAVREIFAAMVAAAPSPDDQPADAQ